MIQIHISRDKLIKKNLFDSKSLLMSNLIYYVFIINVFKGNI